MNVRTPMQFTAPDNANALTPAERIQTLIEMVLTLHALEDARTSADIDFQNASTLGHRNAFYLGQVSDLAVQSVCERGDEILAYLKDLANDKTLENCRLLLMAQSFDAAMRDKRRHADAKRTAARWEPLNEDRIGFYDRGSAKVNLRRIQKAARQMGVDMAAKHDDHLGNRAKKPTELGVKLDPDGTVTMVASEAIFRLAVQQKLTVDRYYDAVNMEGLQQRLRAPLKRKTSQREAKGQFKPVDPLPDQRSFFSGPKSFRRITVKFSLIKHFRDKAIGLFGGGENVR